MAQKTSTALDRVRGSVAAVINETQEKEKAGQKPRLELKGLTWQRKALTSAIKAGLPALLIGETGTGKTSLVQEVANSLWRSVIRINLDGGTTPDELIGRFQLKGNETYFQHGILVSAMRQGAVLLLDEINAALPDTLFALHALLENPACLIIPETGETIKPAKGFSIVATMNPSHEYAGTKGLNPALYSRFSQVLRFDTLKGKTLVEALAAHVPAASDNAVLNVASIIDKAQELLDKESISTRLTIRDGIAALIYSCDGLTLEESLRASLYGRLEPSEQALLGEAELVCEKGVSITELLASAHTQKALESELAETKAKLAELETVSALLTELERHKAKRGEV